jgi:cytochrome c oxidase subunit IV
MKNIIPYLLITIGTFLVINYSFVYADLSSSNPLLRWSIFVEPMIYSAGLILLGILLFGLGVWLIIRLRKQSLSKI